jgi:putative component of membrane protein insertase Oxa1/YidC/SpoIIIJ protein YidD
MRGKEMSTTSDVFFTFFMVFLVIVLLWPIAAKAERPAPANVSVIPIDSTSNQMLFTDGIEQQFDPFSLMVKFYKKYLTHINSSRCPMHPSCSSFAVQALKDHGEKGLVMIFDRLLRCGRDLEDYTLVFKGGRVLRYDPVIKRFEYNKDESPK